MRKVLFLILFAASCENKSDIPDDVIKPRKMQSIFWDMIRADILADEIVKKDSSKNLQKQKDSLAEKVFFFNKINSTSFYNSIDFYEKHPDLLKNILDSLNTSQASKSYIERNHPPLKPRLSLPILHKHE